MVVRVVADRAVEALAVDKASSDRAELHERVTQATSLAIRLAAKRC